MEFAVVMLHLVFVCVILISSAPCSRSHQSPLGIHPLDEEYYDSAVIKCKDGSKSVARDRINDDFCDCADGTDEPGTSACPNGKFYCKNMGSTPRFLFSSRVNDRICDCCDGSDENDGSFRCPNTCIMGGTIFYKSDNYVSKPITDKSSGVRAVKDKTKLEDFIERLTGMKILIILQFVIISFWMVFWIYRRRFKSRRRRYQRLNPH